MITKTTNAFTLQSMDSMTHISEPTSYHDHLDDMNVGDIPNFENSSGIASPPSRNLNRMMRTGNKNNFLRSNTTTEKNSNINSSSHFQSSPSNSGRLIKMQRSNTDVGKNQNNTDQYDFEIKEVLEMESMSSSSESSHAHYAPYSKSLRISVGDVIRECEEDDDGEPDLLEEIEEQIREREKSLKIKELEKIKKLNEMEVEKEEKLKNMMKQVDLDELKAFAESVEEKSVKSSESLKN